MGKLKLSVGKPPSEHTEAEKNKIRTMEFELIKTAKEKKKKDK